MLRRLRWPLIRDTTPFRHCTQAYERSPWSCALPLGTRPPSSESHHPGYGQFPPWAAALGGGHVRDRWTGLSPKAGSLSGWHPMLGTHEHLGIGAV
jgi:hypothetical protein